MTVPPRSGVVISPSNDKGPFKLIKVRSEAREFTVRIIDPYGLVGNPVVGTEVHLSGSVDGGMETATPVDLSEKRFDGLKCGESLFGNTETGNSVHHKENGDTVIKTKGILRINPSE